MHVIDYGQLMVCTHKQKKNKDMKGQRVNEQLSGLYGCIS